MRLRLQPFCPSPRLTIVPITRLPQKLPILRIYVCQYILTHEVTNFNQFYTILGF